MEWHWASISAGCTCHIKPISRVIVGADSSLGIGGNGSTGGGYVSQVDLGMS